MFKWHNLPLGLEQEKLELMLIERGTVSLFNCLEGIYILPYMSTGLSNIYGDPVDVRPVPINGIMLHPIDTVPRILWDNSVRIPFDPFIRMFSHRLADIHKTISILERQARTPSLIAVNETNKESYARVESKIDEGSPVIPIDESMDISKAIMPFDRGFKPEVLRIMFEDANKIEGELFNFLGTMFNVEQNKAAGVGAAETIINYSQTYALANSRLQQRQRFCEKVNNEFGWQMWCEKENDYDDIIADMMKSTARDPGEMAQSASNIEKGEEAQAVERE
jgi:hypothetical protein